MSVAVTLRELGGVARFAELRTVHTRRQIEASVADAQVDRLARGRYALPTIAEHRGVAHRHTAVLSHLSAAQAHGWKVKFPTERPSLTVPPGRVIRDPSAATFRHATLSPSERELGVTSALHTVVDCAKDLRFDEALAVADSALRDRAVSSAQLRRAVATLRGPGTRQARRITACANGRAANPFESVLRAIALDIPELTMQPQVVITDDGLFAQVDLADVHQRLILEADSYEHHAGMSGFLKDRRRYTDLTMFGWHVLSFVWVDVMRHPQWVRWCLQTWLAVRLGRALPARPWAVPRAAGSA